MAARNLYEVLGLTPAASAAEIRKAYILRSKLLHPDRFDDKLQRDEWELANEMLKELNHAYGVLKESSSRADYDRGFSPGSSPKPATYGQEAPRPAAAPPGPPPASANVGRLKSGTGRAKDLPPAVIERLRQRVAGENKAQQAMKLSGVKRHYVFAILGVFWLWPLFSLALGDRWQSDNFPLGLCALTAVAAVILAINLNWILRWHSSPLQCWLLVTPLYFIQTHLDRVWYWPIWELTDLRATHRYRNGGYQGTVVSMRFGQEQKQFEISPEIAYDIMRNTIGAFEAEIQRAKLRQDWQHFRNNDDFREFDPEKVATGAEPAHGRTAGVYAACAAVYALLFLLAMSLNGYQSIRERSVYQRPESPAVPTTLFGTVRPPLALPKPYVPRTSSAYPESPQTSLPAPASYPSSYSSIPRMHSDLDPYIPSYPADPLKPPRRGIFYDDLIPPVVHEKKEAPPFLEPEKPMPKNGDVHSLAGGKTLAPFNIKSSYASNHLVKLADRDSGKAVLTVFVRSGQTAEIHVPLGHYTVKYASGEKWYGPKFLFGPATSYSKAQETFDFIREKDGYSGYTITLYKVVDGNLKTEEIDPEDF